MILSNIKILKIISLTIEKKIIFKPVLFLNTVKNIFSYMNYVLIQRNAGNCWWIIMQHKITAKYLKFKHTRSLKIKTSTKYV